MAKVADETQQDKPKRTASLWQPSPGEWVLTLTEFRPRASAADTHYRLAPLPSDYDRAFRLRKLEADGGEVYDVLLDADGPTCSCPGHTHRGACKHLDALLALQGQGKLDAIPAPRRQAAGPAPESAPATRAWPADARAVPPLWDDL